MRRKWNHWLWLGLAISGWIGLGAVIFLSGLFGAPEEKTSGKEEILRSAFWTGLGILFGAAIIGRQKHPRRLLGLIPFGITGLAVILSLEIIGEPLTLPWSFGLGLFSFLGLMPLICSIHLEWPVQSGAKSLAFRICLLGFIAAGLMFGLYWPIAFQTNTLKEYWPFLALLVLMVAQAWLCFFLPALEQMLELLVWPLYRIRGYGPALEKFPLHGPVVVVANHAAWLDPLWLAKVIPRRVFPMMTSAFYDLPVMRGLMRMVGAIRVQASGFRRDVPELGEAIQVLDKGQCLVIFPEGRMRRSEEKPLHPFGQGVWHILMERPDVPVVVCWIEGNWGSFFSYFHGPPTKNKPMDFWRSIRIAVGEPERLPGELLADRRATRLHLMHRCLELRKVLGLEPEPIAPEIGEEPVEDKWAVQ